MLIFLSHIYNRFYPGLHHHAKGTRLQFGFHPCLAARQRCTHAEGLWITPGVVLETAWFSRGIGLVLQIGGKHLQNRKKCGHWHGYSVIVCPSRPDVFIAAPTKKMKTKNRVHSKSFLHSTSVVVTFSVISGMLLKRAISSYALRVGYIWIPSTISSLSCLYVIRFFGPFLERKRTFKFHLYDKKKTVFGRICLSECPIHSLTFYLELCKRAAVH